MAGITDRPFRQLCRRMGARLVVSEMVTSDISLWHSRKSRLRLDHTGEAEPIAVQIAGAEPAQMAQAARLNADNGAQIIDIDRKSTRLNSSHVAISYAVFCLKKKSNSEYIT